MLVDTSVWIELLAGGRTVRDDDLLRFVTCGPIVQEVLEGLRENAASEAFREAFLAIPRLDDPLSLDAFLEAADIFRLGRRKGYAIRSAVDCLIAAVAIRNKTPIWHKDRDYTAIASYTSLRALAYVQSR